MYILELTEEEMDYMSSLLSEILKISYKIPKKYKTNRTNILQTIYDKISQGKNKKNFCD